MNKLQTIYKMKTFTITVTSIAPVGSHDVKNAVKIYTNWHGYDNHFNHTMLVFDNYENPLSKIEFKKFVKDVNKFSNKVVKNLSDKVVLRDKVIMLFENQCVTLCSMEGRVMFTVC